MLQNGVGWTTSNSSGPTVSRVIRNSPEGALTSCGSAPFAEGTVAESAIDETAVAEGAVAEAPVAEAAIGETTAVAEGSIHEGCELLAVGRARECVCQLIRAFFGIGLVGRLLFGGFRQDGLREHHSAGGSRHAAQETLQELTTCRDTHVLVSANA